jgi:hypothetical protein
MKLELHADVKTLKACLPEFLSLAGPDRWKKRAAQLASDLSRSPSLAKITLDHHWLELALSEQLVALEAGAPAKVGLSLDALAAMEFAQMVVEIHRRLSPKGQNALLGRMRDSLKAESGFASLYLELGIARLLIGGGFDVESSDLEGLARYDLRFWNQRVEGEVECKSVSVDAGRKIHRKDFYRFIDALTPQIMARIESGASEVLVITLDDRLPSRMAQQLRLRAATKLMLENTNRGALQEDFFTIDRDDFSNRLAGSSYKDPEQFYRVCRSAYGENCHVSGAAGDSASCLIVMRSRREDDHSKPLLDALKKAALQFSTTRPGFIAVQFDDIAPSDLLSIHLRRRIGLLSYYLFHECPAQHVVATYFCIYGGLSASPKGIGAAAIAVPNPKTRFKVAPGDYPPFLLSIPDAEFARLLGAPLPTENLSYIPFEPKKP